MTTAVQHRRGTTAEHATFTGLEGEVTIDTTKDTAVIHDGVLAGGVPLARENLANVTPSGLATITGASTASDDKFFIYDQSATTLKSITRAELNNAMEIDALANVTITGGTINGTTIGNTTPAAGTFTQANFADNAKAVFGAGSDLQIYHNGSNSLIEETGTGALIIRSNSFALQNAAGNETIASMSENGAVSLFFDNAAKLATTSTGIDVTGTVVADGLTVDGLVKSDTASNGFRVLKGSGAYYGELSVDYISNDVFTYVDSIAGASYNGIVKIRTANNGGSVADRVRISSSGVSFYEDTGTTPKFFWDASAESLGIGTSSPAQAKLDILLESDYSSHTGHGLSILSNAANAYTSLYIGTDDTIDSAYIQSAGKNTSFTSKKLLLNPNGGNVGIGTSLPSSKLDIKVATDAKLLVQEGNTAGNVKMQAVNNAVSLNTNLEIAALNTQFFNGGSERMRIDSAGNVGIGTSSPAETLDVRNVTDYQLILGYSGSNNYYKIGRSGSTGLLNFYGSQTGYNGYVFSGVDGERMRITSAGSVGIGTSSPRGILDISKSDSVNAVQFYLENTSTSEVGLRIRRNASDIGFVGTAAWSITGGGSTNFGINGVNALVFGVGSTERARIDSSGNVGIGTTLPGSKLEVAAPSSGGAVTNGIAITNAGSGAGTGSSLFLGYGTTVGKYGSVSGFYDGTGTALTFGTTPSASSAAVVERARIDSSGNLLVGTTSVGISNTNGLTIEGASGFQTINHGNGSPSGKLYIQFGYYAGAIGSITQSGTTAVLYNTTSDQRLKENIVDADSASVLIDSLQVRQFDWKSENSHQRYGFVAQELVNVAPEAVHQPADPEEMMAVDYSKLVPMLVKEIQSLRQRLAAAGI
jgi:hypothetical protein